MHMALQNNFGTKVVVTEKNNLTYNLINYYENDNCFPVYPMNRFETGCHFS